MARIYIKSGGKQLYYILKLPTEIYLIPHKMAEIAILKIIRDIRKLNILVSLDVLSLVRIGQVLSEILSVLDIIPQIFISELLIIFKI